jgi:SAM-dependent methyltransferase
MSDWGQGYHVDIPYVVGFYPELAPVHLESALLFAGFKANLTNQGAQYCELGCGYGLTTLILAAANPHMSFVGVDFNPTHIVAANALAQSANLHNVRFIERSFDELLDPRFADLGEFNIIALHGVYSWVAPTIRRAIVKFAEAKLATGGALYVSYNAAPGWMPRAPLQRLLFEWAKRNPGEPRAATADALRFAKAMKEAGAFYFKANPQAGAFIESMEGMSLAYLVHEHLNASWSALYHADVAADFALTRLSYACSAYIADNFDETSVPITTHDLLRGPGDEGWVETVKDFLVGRSFRRDIFVRGAIKMTSVEMFREFDDRVFTLIVPRSAANGKIPTVMGEVEGRSDLYPVVLDLLAGGPTRLSELVSRASGPAKDPKTLIQALALLTHAGQIKMTRENMRIDPAPSRNLNLALAREIAAGKIVQALAAPVIATGIPGELTDFGMLMARERGLPLNAETIARTTWDMIEPTSIRPTKDRKAIQDRVEALAHLTAVAERLVSGKLRILESLGV